MASVLILRIVDVDAVHGTNVESVHWLESSVEGRHSVQKRFRWKTPVTREQAVCFCRALNRNLAFRNHLVSHLSQLPFKRSEPRELEVFDAVGLKLIADPCPLYLDKKWSHLLSRLVIMRMETEDVMAMLSTLGGAYSCLGESDPCSALTAGRIAQSQLLLSKLTGDPNLVIRCWIYRVYSYCQMRMRSQAIRLMQKIYPFIVQLRNSGKCEIAVIRMYQAATHRIKHMNQRYMNYIFVP